MMNRLVFSYVTGWQSGDKLGQGRGPSHYYCAMHSHQSFEIVYYPAGRGTSDTERGDRFLYAPGTVTIYPPNLRHDQRVEVPGVDVCVHFEIGETVPEELDRAISISDMRDHVMEADLLRLSTPESKMSEMRKAILGKRLARWFWHYWKWKVSVGMRMSPGLLSMPVRRVPILLKNMLRSIALKRLRRRLV